MHCTQCGVAGQGRFCASCGASLKALACRDCGTRLRAGTRFCISCGTPVGAAVARGVPAQVGGPADAVGTGGQRRPDLGWWVAGGLLAVALVVVGIGLLRESESPSPASSFGAPAAASGAPPDLSTMTPREAADRLFNRVMSAAAREDTVEANSFLPMAINAYELASPLDDDGLFHLSLLQRAAADFDGSLASAQEGLQENPDHLLNLSSAAEASLQLGQDEEGRAYYQRLMDAWDRELAAGRVEYEEHRPLLPLIREDAEALLSSAATP